MRVHGLGREWAWPEEDDKCRQVVFNWSIDLQYAYQHCKAFDVVVQAGGNMGVWPWLLAKKFRRVFTFEADPRCWPYLLENLEGVGRFKVDARPQGLWSEPSHATIHNDPHEQRNLGAQFIRTADEGIELVTVDSLQLSACDLIYLDIEGAELPALHGARDTIEKFRPVIAVEDKQLSKRYGYEKGDIEKWLALDYGYEVVARPHRDVVLACK